MYLRNEICNDHIKWVERNVDLEYWQKEEVQHLQEKNWAHIFQEGFPRDGTGDIG